MSEMSEISKALVAAQEQFPPIHKTKEVEVRTKTGGKYTFSYSPLEDILTAVRPILNGHGLAVVQIAQSGEGTVGVSTCLFHESGQTIQGGAVMAKAPESPQEMGSLITYLRRYSLTAFLGLASEEDDDGNAATGNEVKKSVQAPPKPAPPAAKDGQSATDQYDLMQISHSVKAKGIEKLRVTEFMQEKFGKSTSNVLSSDEIQVLKAWVANL